MKDDSGSLPHKLRRIAGNAGGGQAGGCSFCGRELGEVAYLIAGAKARICSDCLRECTSAMSSRERPREST